MFTVSWWMHCLNFAEIGSLAAVVGIILWRRQLTRWPALFISLAFELAVDLRLQYLLLHPAHNLKPYFYTYWVAMGIQAFLRLFIIADVIRSFPGLDFIPKGLYYFWGTIACSTASAVGIYCFRQQHITPMKIKDCAILMDQCTWVAWGVFFVAYLGLFKVLNFGWSELGAKITTGFGIRVCTGIAVAGLLTNKSVGFRAAVNVLESLTTIAVFLFWVYTFSKSPKKHEPALDSPHSPRTMAILLAIASSRER